MQTIQPQSVTRNIFLEIEQISVAGKYKKGNEYISSALIRLDNIVTIEKTKSGKAKIQTVQTNPFISEANFFYSADPYEQVVVKFKELLKGVN